MKGNADKLLNGLCTNTSDASKNAFIDITGRIIATFDQLKVDENHVIIIIEEQFYGRLLKHLEKYLKLSKCTIERESYNVYFELDGNYKCKKEELVIPQKKGQIILTKKKPESNVTDEEFTIFRLENNIPVQGIDYDREMLLNIGEDYVSFTKGCYLGQEIIARVKYKSKPPKRLVVENGKFAFVNNEKLIF